jgi:hypothetical protein
VHHSSIFLSFAILLIIIIDGFFLNLTFFYGMKIGLNQNLNPPLFFKIRQTLVLGAIIAILLRRTDVQSFVSSALPNLVFFFALLLSWHCPRFAALYHFVACISKPATNLSP